MNAIQVFVNSKVLNFLEFTSFCYESFCPKIRLSPYLVLFLHVVSFVFFCPFLLFVDLLYF